MIRPKPARWFEILAARDDATLALEALATTGMIELEARPDSVSPASLEETQPLLAEFAELTARYRPYWPQTGYRCSAFPEPPTIALKRGLSVLRAWAHDAEPAIRRLQAIEAAQAEIRIWQPALSALGNNSIDLMQLGRTGPVLDKRLVAFPGETFPDMPSDALVRPLGKDGGSLHALVVGTGETIRSIERQAAALKGGAWAPPDWLRPNAAANAAYIASREDALQREAMTLRSTLEALQSRHDVHRALGDIYRVQWVMQNVRALEAGDLFCWITGWTSDPAGRRLAAALEKSGARAVLHFPDPAAKARPPLLLVNPWWARPFEIFSRALGVPSRNEADPSVLLALVVPLMFGYMFGDVGQGLVITVGGILLRNWFPAARLLVAGGVAAMAFGVLFGSVFSLEAFSPVWMAPLDEPLTVLWVPLIGGAVLLLIGLLLNGAEARWRGQFREWLIADSGFIVTYIALLASPLVPATWLVAVAGALLFCAGHAWNARKLSAGLIAIADFVERLIQLLINTLSFVRVGAFALAHAGLSSAIVALMDAGTNIAVKAAVLVFGNILILTLETMVVSIQTTRLVLFEFFTRFLTADGRIFRPLPPPPSIAIPQEA
jgi:V/A-type H+-transporting ATPase subunit I